MRPFRDVKLGLSFGGFSFNADQQLLEKKYLKLQLTVLLIGENRIK